MRHIILVFLFFSFQNTLFGANVDSLINRAKLLKGKEKIDLLTELCWELKYSDHKEALSYCMEGLKMAQENSYAEQEAELLRNIATVYLIKSDFKLAQDYCNKAITLFQKQNNATGIAKVRNILGLINSNKGNFEEAIKEFEQSIVLFQALGDTSQVIAIEANIGNIYLKKGEYQKAIPAYKRIVAEARQNKDIPKLGLNIFNLGIVYVKLGDYPQALSYLIEASTISKSLDNHFHWIKTQNEIGLIYKRLDLIEEAIELYQPALRKAIELENKTLIASLFNNLGLCYSKINRLEEALDFYHKSLEIRESLNILDVGHILNNIGSIHHKNGNDELALDYYTQALETNTQLNLHNKLALDQSNLGQLYLDQGEYAKAEPYLLDAFSILKETKELKELTIVTELLIILYQKKKQKPEETNYRELHRIYSDSLYNKEKLLASNRIIIREQLKEKNDLIDKSKEALTNVEIENKTIQKNNKLLFGFFILLLGLVAYAIYYRRKIQFKQQKLSEHLEKTKSENFILQDSLQEQNRELVLFSLDMVQKEEMIKSLKNHLSALAKKQPNNSEFRSLLNKLTINDVITKDWSYFNEVFNKAFPGFTEKIRKTYPNLSRKELQHCVLIKLNTPPAEAANIMGITTESVHTARYRLRKKFNLVRKESLEDIILNI